MQKLTNEIADQRLLDGNRTIVRVGNVINGEKKNLWKCKLEHCNYMWFNLQ